MPADDNSMMANLPASPDALFCLAVYRAAHQINRAYGPHLRRLGLTYPQYITLQFLWDEDARTVGDLSAALGMETNTLTPLLKRMEGLGLITRQSGKADRRQVVVRLTDAGKELRAHAPEITACMVKSTGFDPARLERLVGELRQLTEAIQEPE